MTSISGKVDPVVRSITAGDIAEAFGEGLRDFQAVPLYGLAFGALYAAGGIAILLCLTAFGLVYLAYPLAAGFAMIGPFVATGLYEVSRRRETGQAISIGAIWATVKARGEIGWMAFVTLFVFVIWMYQVRLLIALLLGLNASFSSLREFITVVLTTNEGLLFLAIGNAVGAALSLILFSLTVVSFPLLLDRDVDFVTAMVTSVRAVVTSPVPMIGWAAVIVVLLAVSAIPYFLGLVVTLPVLGHATWHLYRRIIAPVAGAIDQPLSSRASVELRPGRTSHATPDGMRVSLRHPDSQFLQCRQHSLRRLHLDDHRAAGFQQALQAGEDRGPAGAAAGQDVVADRTVVRLDQRQLHHVPHGLDLVGHQRRAEFFDQRRPVDVEGDGKLPQGIAFDHLAARCAPRHPACAR